jgi:hypothetical protein
MFFTSAQRPQPITGIGYSLIASIAMILSSVQAAETDVRAFVHTRYRHGIPYDQAVRFGPSNVPILLEMLRDPAERDFYPNIIWTLGVIGDGRATDPLINFLERDIQGEIDPVLIRALMTVPMALGHIAAKGNTNALNYLVSRAGADAWRNRKLPWKAQGRSGEQVYGTDLIDGSIMALGISARPEAIRALKDLEARPGVHEALRATAKEAMKLARRISSNGRSKVFAGR